MAAVKQKSNLLSNLLGLDENPGQGMAQPLQGQATKEVERPQSGWGATLQSLKLSDALQGINVTPNFLFLLLFLGFAGWLWVVYWIRHNEPLANSVLGTHTAQSTTTHADRSMLAGIKKTLPVRTSNNMGDYYVPIPHQGGIAASGDYGHGGAGAYAYPPHTALPAHSPAHQCRCRNLCRCPHHRSRRLCRTTTTRMRHLNNLIINRMGPLTWCRSSSPRARV
jgi:hypothetical protein